MQNTPYLIAELCEKYSDAITSRAGHISRHYPPRMWNTWLDDLPKLATISIPKCLKPSLFGETSLHLICIS